MIRLPWRAQPGVCGNLLKLSWDRGSPHPLHDHDYPELFWIDEGPCRHRINGGDEILQRGELIFIRAADRHQLSAMSAGRFTMTNLECQPALIRALKARHPQPFAKWFDERPARPCKIALTETQLQQVQHIAMELSGRWSDALSVEGFCLDLARLLAPMRPVVANLALCPDWLQDALLRAQSPKIFSQGVSGLARAAGRSPEHISRQCMSALGRRPTDIIEEYRMIFAEKQLRLTSMPILEIALECGYATTAQFHRAFKKHHGRTPLRYRHWVRGQ